MNRRRLLRWCAVVGAVSVGPTMLRGAEPITLKYLSRFEASHNGEHIMGGEVVAGHYGLVSRNSDVLVVDLETLPSEGTKEYLAMLPDIDIYNTTTLNDEWVYGNIRMGGTAVIHFDAAGPSLSLVRTISEPGVYFEKNTIVGNRLYTAAHSSGIRIYSLTNPQNPVLVGQLTTGFADAFSIAVDGTTAYVADGAGGLKIVDLSNESSPVIICGEDVNTAVGTAQDILFTAGRVYVASGFAGVAVYEPGDLGSRVLHDTPICAKQLARIGDYLAVADLAGVEVFGIEADGTLTHVARESSTMRMAGFRMYGYRNWHGVCAWGDDKLVTANFDFLDVYQLVDPATDDQPDIAVKPQRLNFDPAGGTKYVTVSSTGAGTLELSSIYSNIPSYTVTPTSGVLAPGETLELTINYTGGGEPGAGYIHLEGNDPDESPMPIAVLGKTQFLDIGEPAVPFTLESWTMDHETGEYSEGEFNMDACLGQIVFIHFFVTI